MSPETQRFADELRARMPKFLPAEFLQLQKEGVFAWDLESMALLAVLGSAGLGAQQAVEQSQKLLADAHRATDDRLTALRQLVDALERGARISSSVQVSAGHSSLLRVEQILRDSRAEIRAEQKELLGELVDYLRTQSLEERRKLADLVKGLPLDLTRVTSLPQATPVPSPQQPVEVEPRPNRFLAGFALGAALAAAIALALHLT